MKKRRNDKIGRIRVYKTFFAGRDDADSIVWWDVQNISHEQTIRVNIISTNSKYKQGIRLGIDAGKGFLEFDGQKAKSFGLWEAIFPEEGVIVKCVSSEGVLSVYNIWDEEIGRHVALKSRSGMIIEECEGKTIYRCNNANYNDFRKTIDDTKFDALVFSIEKL